MSNFVILSVWLQWCIYCRTHRTAASITAPTAVDTRYTLSIALAGSMQTVPVPQASVTTGLSQTDITGKT